jgi:hypothetical protein
MVIFSFHFFVQIVFGFLLWIAWLEIGPGLGKIWLRPDFENKIRFQFGGILAVVDACFRNSSLWAPGMWDVNPFTMTLIPATLIGIWQILTEKILPWLLS